MTTKLQSLISALYSGNIKKEDFIKEYFKRKAPSEEYVQSLIQKAIVDKDQDLVEEAIVLLYLDYFNLDIYLMQLCQLLVEDWHIKHEDITLLLKKINSPVSVDYLFKASVMKLEYLEYDETYQFARKCIKAISEIGDENAIQKLKILSGNEIVIIANYAKKELQYKGLL